VVIAAVVWAAYALIQKQLLMRLLAGDPAFHLRSPARRCCPCHRPLLQLM
jgi:hypothetical protein